MTKVIVGIHGLANKPEKVLLAEWWESSIREGLKRNCGVSKPEFDFHMVHWADLLYKNPLHDDDNYNFDKLYNDEPHKKATGSGRLEEYMDGFRDKVVASALGLVGSSVDFLKEHFEMNKLADWVLGKVLKDLDLYYDDKRNNRARYR